MAPLRVGKVVSKMKKLLALYVVGIAAMMAVLPAAKAGTIALWTFEDGTVGNPAGTVTATVSGQDGTALNGPLYVGGVKTAFGNQGLSLNGVNQNVHIPTTFGGPLDLTGSFTLEVGIVHGSGQGFPIFMGGILPGQDPYYLFVGSDGSVSFQTYLGGPTGFISSAPGALVSGELQHIAAVFDTSGPDNFMYLYVDDILVANQNVGSNTIAYTDPDTDLWFGSVDNNQFGFYNGILTDVRISDMALTPSQFFAVPEPGMVAVFGLGLLGIGLARRRV